MRPADSGETCCWRGGYAIGQSVAVVQDQDQVAQVKTKLLKHKLWTTVITDHELTANAACSVLRLTSNRCCVPAAMARTKRKWTREAIEEALLQNTRVNASPAEPEDAAAKRKRQRRRSNKKRNLIKELRALSVTETESANPQAVPVIQDQPMLQAQTTMEQEGKQEEDDPADHHRRFAVAYAEGQRQAALDAQLQVTHPSSADRAAVKRARNAERQRARRANMTASQTERVKDRERVRRKAARSRMTASQTERRRAKDRERQRARRAQLTGPQRAATRVADRQRRQDRRAAKMLTNAPRPNMKIKLGVQRFVLSKQTKSVMSSASKTVSAVRRPNDATVM
ncbi:unnamed protein product [Phytophthora fragariaefolia]|uniref:Unnamed protein product n=1 Tax=Phytophthora fragariaefolia TaxID=1490495 RepID=A0A9W6YC16_9STRA|nr:unnamed protein product [Phytophthora fragariaefolia]